MKKLIGFFDMDGPLADFDIAANNETRGIWERSPECMYEPGFFRNMPVTEGAKEAVKEIMAMDHVDMYIASKPVDEKNFSSASEKFEWLNEHFPELTQKVMLTCDKKLLNGDFLIDDYLKWSKTFEGEFLHFDVTDTKKSWAEIVEKVRSYGS